MIAEFSGRKAFLIFRAAILITALIIQGCEKTDSPDRLGLTKEAKRSGDPVDGQVLRKNAEAAADRHLLHQADALEKFTGGPYTLTLDYPQIPFIRKLGYKSSFYYFCWDLFLPYRLKTAAGDSYLLIVQVSDRTPGNQHDIDKFHVLSMNIIDKQGRAKEVFRE